MIDLSDTIAPLGFAPLPGQTAAPRGSIIGNRKPPIGDSEDLQRIMGLARRPPLLSTDGERAAALVELMTQRYRRARTTPCTCRLIEPSRTDCITQLNPVQAWALYEIGIMLGLEGAIGVGHGKTVLDWLAPLAFADGLVDQKRRQGIVMKRSEVRALLLLPSNLIDQADKEYQLLAQHFRMPTVVYHTRAIHRQCADEPEVHVVPYTKLSSKECTTFLRTLAPHVIIADESHCISDRKSVRTDRLCRYYDAAQPAYANWSGSITGNDIRDYSHHTFMALRDKSPLPIKPEVVAEWSNVLGADGLKGLYADEETDGEAAEVSKQSWGADPGALLEALIAHGFAQPGEHVLTAFSRRLRETWGFITTSSPAVGAKLEIRERVPHVDDCAPGPNKVPNVPRVDDRAPGGAWPGVADAIEQAHKGLRPDGEELLEPLKIARCEQELACGFFYRWIFPRGESLELIAEWLEARKKWRQELRDKMYSRSEHLDSIGLLQLAAMRAWGNLPNADAQGMVEHIDEDGEVLRVAANALPMWKAETWPRWAAVKDQVKPQTEPVWIDEYLARDAAQWAHEHRGIVWYEHSAFGHMVAKLSGLPLHGGGPDAGPRLVGGEFEGVNYPGVDGKTSIICSVKSHGTGRNGLQYRYNEQLFANPKSSAAGWEQNLGRLHRIGQPEEVVRTWFYRHTRALRRLVNKALARALYIDSSLGASQKLQIGFDLPRDGNF